MTIRAPVLIGTCTLLLTACAPVGPRYQTPELKKVAERPSRRASAVDLGSTPPVVQRSGFYVVTVPGEVDQESVRASWESAGFEFVEELARSEGSCYLLFLAETALSTPDLARVTVEYDGKHLLYLEGSPPRFAENSAGLSPWQYGATGLEQTQGFLGAFADFKVAFWDTGVQYGHSGLFHVRPGVRQASRSSFRNLIHATLPDAPSFKRHGTGVLSVAFGPVSSKEGVEVVRNARWLIVHQTLINEYLVAPTYPYIKAIDKAIRQKVDLVSFSGAIPVKRTSRALDTMFRKAARHGIIFVCAAGNEGIDLDDPHRSERLLPIDLDLPNVIVVAGLSRYRQGDEPILYPESNHGARRVHIAAPGEDIWCADPSSPQGWREATGTSFAVPQVTGALGLLWDRLGGPGIKAGKVGADRLERAEAVVSSFLMVATMASNALAGERGDLVNARRYLDLSEIRLRLRELESGDRAKD